MEPDFFAEVLEMAAYCHSLITRGCSQNVDGLGSGPYSQISKDTRMTRQPDSLSK
jgi:hypothetical protein